MEPIWVLQYLSQEPAVCAAREVENFAQGPCQQNHRCLNKLYRVSMKFEGELHVYICIHTLKCFLFY